MLRQLYWVRKDIAWYQKELRIDKSYINYDEQKQQAQGVLL